MSSGSEPAHGRGFTLVEVLVAIVGLAIILIAAGQLVFATRRAAQRQSMQVEARQVARGAVDYLAFMVRGATDMNGVASPRDPTAIVTWVWHNTAVGGPPSPVPACPGDAGCQQASWDNVGQRAGNPANLADAGTDILVIAHATSGLEIPLNAWPSFTTTAASDAYWAFGDGCTVGGDAKNLLLFEQATGFDSTAGKSGPLIVSDSTGAWFWYQILTAPTSICSGGGACATGGACVQANMGPGLAGALFPPGAAITAPVAANGAKLAAGVQFTSFRVCQGWLEQKNGIFDQTVDGGSGANACDPTKGWNTDPWTPLLPNVEDLQFAWVYDATHTWNGNNVNLYDNDSTNEIASAGAVPSQGTPANALDVTRVLGLRITVTTRSSASAELANVPTFRPTAFRAAAENHPGATAPDAFYHYQASALALLRNRAPGM